MEPTGRRTTYTPGRSQERKTHYTTSRRDAHHHRHRSPDRHQERTREEPDQPMPRVVSVGRSSSHSQAGAPTIAAPGQLAISHRQRAFFRYVEAVEVPRHITYVKEDLRERRHNKDRTDSSDLSTHGGRDLVETRTTPHQRLVPYVCQ